MSEIDKLYKNAGIEPDINYICDIEPPCEECLLYGCEEGSRSYDRIEGYPDFTAEKQIELIKFLLKNYEGVDISKKINRFNFLVDNATFTGCRYVDKSFEESLAGVVNKLWADMPEEEKQQVKGILE